MFPMDVSLPSQTQTRSDGAGPQLQAGVLSQRGQVILEYILLLIVSVSLAFLIITQLVGTSGDEGEPGIVVQTWRALTQGVADDYPD